MTAVLASRKHGCARKGSSTRFACDPTAPICPYMIDAPAPLGVQQTNSVRSVGLHLWDSAITFARSARLDCLCCDTARIRLGRRAAIVKITPLPMAHHRGRDLVPVLRTRLRVLVAHRQLSAVTSGQFRPGYVPTLESENSTWSQLRVHPQAVYPSH